jgi:hypothetical protein
VAGWALQALASIWETRDLGIAAYFYRWSAELESIVPAIPYVHLYRCLLLAGRRTEIEDELRECERTGSKAVRDLLRIAAARHVMGMKQAADEAWAEATRLMPQHPGYCAPGVWEHHVQLAKAIVLPVVAD